MALMSTERQALADALDNVVDGLRVHTEWPDQVTPPAAMVRPSPGAAMTVDGFSDSWLFLFDVEVIVSTSAGLDKAQRALDGYLDTEGSDSLIAAIDRLGKSAVVSVNDYAGRTIGGNDTYLGATLKVQVFV